MCRHYAPQYTGQCQHDLADHVTDKEKANFCDYFRPRPGAFHHGEDEKSLSAKSALAELFESGGTDSAGVSRRERARNETDRSRRELDDLFDGASSRDAKE